MEDLFEREQRIFDNAAGRLEEIKNGAVCGGEEFEALVREYGKLLKQLRRVTKISDRTTVDLNASKLDLMDKVNYDALTGIYNRRFMEDSLKQIMTAMARSDGDVLSVMLVDVDFFKRYNDTYGHGMGDDCLKAVANALSGSIMRAGDFVARYGGEEFAVVLPYTNERGARILAEKLLENVRECRIPHEKNDAADHVTVSIGVTTGIVKYGQSGDDYIRKSDEALYISKQSGRNRYTFVSFEGNVQ